MDIDGNMVWISETTGGGIGLITKIADAINQYPRNFELQLDDCLQYCEREHLAGQLELVSEKIAQGQSIIKHAFDEIRKSVDLPKIESSRLLLTHALKSFGIPISREIIVALNTKYLRPNSDHDSDDLIATLVGEWTKQEERLGITIDLRVMAVAACRIPAIQSLIKVLLARTGGGIYELDENQVFNLLQSLLWLKCTDSCPECIEYWNPYQELPHPSRYLVSSLINLDMPAIYYQEENWVDKLRESLASRYQAFILCEQDQLNDCKKSLLETITAPIEIGFQVLYPTIEGINQKDKWWQISIVIRELFGN
jgi:hypothetical protein